MNLFVSPFKSDKCCFIIVQTILKLVSRDVTHTKSIAVTRKVNGN